MRWFEPFAVSTDLRDVLSCRYVATTVGRHDLIPDGCMDLLWIDGVATVLCGPDTQAWSFELPAGTGVAGIRFHPGAAAGVFGFEAADVRDQRVDVVDLLGDAEGHRLVERLADADDSIARTDVLEDLVRRRTRDADRDATVELAALVASDAAYGVEALAAQTGVSSRQLRRRFDRAVGYGPAFFARIARLQRFARAAARRPERGIAELAVGAGYVDQPHLAKDCRSLVGVTPRQLIDVLPRTSLAVTLREPSATAGRSRPSAA